MLQRILLKTNINVFKINYPKRKHKQNLVYLSSNYYSSVDERNKIVKYKYDCVCVCPSVSVFVCVCVAKEKAFVRLATTTVALSLKRCRKLNTYK